MKRTVFIIVFVLGALSALTCRKEGSKSVTLKWKYELGSSSILSGAPPAIGSDGTIYIAWDKYLYAVTPSGTLKWQYQTEDWIFTCPTLASDGSIFFASLDSFLYALTPSGVLNWRSHLGDEVFSSPAIGKDGTIYVGSCDNKLYAFTPEGKLKWQYETGSDIFSSPTISKDGTIYFGSDDNHLYALNENGSLKWSYETYDDVTSTPILGHDGTIYFMLEGNFVAVSDIGQLRWVNDELFLVEEDFSPYVIDTGGIIWIGDNRYLDSHIYTITSSGEIKQEYPIEGGIVFAPTVGADGNLYFASTNDCIYSLSPSGKLKRLYEVEGGINSPLVISSDGTIYFTSEKYLYAVQSSCPGLASTPWPKFGADNQNTGRVNAP